ncbi:MAG TPA: PCMD domain-containing protein [Chitinophagales bacterium]|nr:PCMD domain-containing protein [Chitinophagales bacterium]
MNKILLLVLAAFISLSASAQTTITNGNMESWTGSGATMEPAQWNSNKTGGGQAPNGPQTCFQEATNPHSGTYCAKVKTGLAFGIVVVNGSLTTGKVEAPSTSKAEGYIRTIPGGDYGMQFTGRPDSLVFWYRYDSYSSDYPRVEARLHVGYAYAPEAPVNGNHPDSTSNIIARAQWGNVPTSDVTTWTRVSLPFAYVANDTRTPQYILITTTSSGNQTGGSNNSTLWLDDFEAIYNPTVATGTIAPLSYYVSATQGTSVTVPFTLTGTFTAGNTVTAELSDASGSFTSPTVIGSVTATASGSITATIPAGTATGTGYRIRVKTSTPALTATVNNGSDIAITLVTTSVTPSNTENIGAGTSGTTRNVTETAGVVSREWKFSTVSGSGYQSFGTAETGASYIPNFANAGTYYVIVESTYPGGLVVTSNEVQFNVVANSIAPSASQSILVGVNGTPLTVSETPTGMWREWMYSTTAGGPYISFVPAITGLTSYTPNFASAGNYYVVCKSEINSVMVFSNEVLISVGNATITTSGVTGSPYEFSPNAPDASVSVAFTTSGTFNNGNVFTAQISDATGSFTAATNIGTLTATSAGTISASVPHTLPAGTGYRIRVVSDNPVVLGSDNGTDLVIDQFNNSIAPPSAQTIMHSTNGTALGVFASQTSTQEWKYATVSGGPYTSFSPAETGSGYTPTFATPGTYYVVAVSTNTYGDDVTSNEVQIDVTNGSTLTTSAINGSPFDVSPSMQAPVTVNFTSDVVFNAGNVFTAQLSDYTGSFANPTAIGTLNGATIGAISANIPGNTAGGSAYRIRVVSSDPAITGTDNGTDLVVNPFQTSIAPLDTQHLTQNQNGATLTVTESQAATRTWKYSEVSGLGYTGFNPAETGSTLIPHFNLISTYYIICESKNTANDVLVSEEVVVIVTAPNGIGEASAEFVKAYWNGNSLMVDLSSSKLTAPAIEVMNASGQVLVRETLSARTLNTVATSLSSGVYFFKITDGSNSYGGKTVKQ